MDQDEVFEDTWKNQMDEWLDNVKNDVLKTNFGYARWKTNVTKDNRLGNEKQFNFALTRMEIFQ